MSDIDLTAVLARVRERLGTELLDHADVRLIYEELLLDVICRNGLERDRLRQLLTGLMAKCPTCGGSGREVFASRADCPPKLCLTCGPTRAAMEAK